MLTSDQIAALRDAAEQITQPMTDYLIREIARRISEAGQLTSTAAYEIWQVQKLGLSQREIKAKLQKQLKISSQQIESLLTQSAEAGYNFDMDKLPTSAAIPFEENFTLQQIISAYVKLAQDDFTNITQTLGMIDPYGRALPLQEAYRSAIDYAFKQASTGATDYNTAVRQAIKNLVNKGVRVIDYESGVHRSVEAAVRGSIMGGLGLMQEQISQQVHDDLGADGWEISAHAASAPDHEPIQGRQYSDAEYQALNNALVRRIGTLNCGHAAFPIILGVSSPQYTEDELREFREKNEAGIVYQGRHYTMYEATQMQHKIERSIRTQKRRILADEATGDDEKLKVDQIKLNRLNDEYRRFSKAAGLRTQDDRMEIIGYNWKQERAAEKTFAKYAKIHYNKDGIIVVTDDWKPKGKVSIPQKYLPNAVVETKTQYKNGVVQIDRTIYGADSRIKTQIHSGAHNRIDKHPYGERGEHAHDYSWTDGKSAKTVRNLSDAERTANADILKNGDDNETED